MRLPRSSGHVPERTSSSIRKFTTPRSSSLSPKSVPPTWFPTTRSWSSAATGASTFRGDGLPVTWPSATWRRTPDHVHTSVLPLPSGSSSVSSSPVPVRWQGTAPGRLDSTSTKRMGVCPVNHRTRREALSRRSTTTLCTEISTWHHSPPTGTHPAEQPSTTESPTRRHSEASEPRSAWPQHANVMGMWRGGPTAWRVGLGAEGAR
mmetsp:Transcript_12540/g.33689  ORF Transcript_12540/g.33689 Transcript_12540/m.33689 type:complete len:206 (+) Transcript_12540:315-932(+)